jgi:hypothetical protein
MYNKYVNNMSLSELQKESGIIIMPSASPVRTEKADRSCTNWTALSSTLGEE